MNGAACKGFTLLEAMVVLLIVAILVVIGMPSFVSTIQRSRVNAVAGRLYEDVYFTKSEAIKRNVPMYMTFSGAAAGATSATGWTVNDGTNQIKSFALSDYPNVSMIIANNSIEFDPLRGAIAITQNILLSNPYGCITVSLTPLGYAEIGDFFSC